MTADISQFYPPFYIHSFLYYSRLANSGQKQYDLYLTHYFFSHSSVRLPINLSPPTCNRRITFAFARQVFLVHPCNGMHKEDVGHNDKIKCISSPIHFVRACRSAFAFASRVFPIPTSPTQKRIAMRRPGMQGRLDASSVVHPGRPMSCTRTTFD